MLKNLSFLFIFFFQYSILNSQIAGAYELKGQGDPGEKSLLIITDQYLSIAVFNTQTNDFIRTYGGAYQIKDKKLHLLLEFDTKDTMQIGQTIVFNFSISQKTLELENAIKVKWNKIDESASALTGLWRITDRLGNNGQLTAMPQGDRKTLKIMSGTKFQWVAINPKTKQFSGTGGGSYTLMNGTYTEKIEFFSRDKTRVGAELKFEGSVADNKWTHKGTSSTGNPVHEIWTKQ